jgi:hypothetical protein
VSSYAAAVKGAYPSSFVFGTSAWGWCEYPFFSLSPLLLSLFCILFESNTDIGIPRRMEVARLELTELRMFSLPFLSLTQILC